MTFYERLIGLLAQLIDLPLPAWILIKITGLLAVAWVFHWVIAGANPRWRVLLWRGTAIALVVMPIWIGFGPLLTVSTVDPRATTDNVSSGASSDLARGQVNEPVVLGDSIDAVRKDLANSAHALDAISGDVSRRSISASSVRPGQETAGAAGSRNHVGSLTGSSVHWSIVYCVVWSLGFVLFTLRMVVGGRQVALILAKAMAPPTWVTDLFARVAGDLGCRRSVQLTSSAETRIPFLWGLWRRRIVLPAMFWSPRFADNLPAIFAHELAHAESHDFFWNMLLHLHTAVLWFHPFAWKVPAAHAASCEAVADAVSATYVGSAESYSNTLASVALETLSRPAAIVVTMARTAEISRRLDALKKTVPYRSLSWPAVMFAAFTGSSVILLTASLGFAHSDPSEAKQIEGKSPTEPSAASDVLHRDPKMAEIIRAVRENEERYRDLETVVQIQKLVPTEDDPEKSTLVADDRRQTIIQGDLFYIRAEEARTQADGKKRHHERCSAFDGEKTRSVDYDQSANIHLGRFESRYIYPPHSWALFASYLNFPLSVYLQGTDAIRRHPKVRPIGDGSIFDFTRVEFGFDGEETVNGLKCVRIGGQRWYGHGRASHRLWLAVERNYLCVKSQIIFPSKDSRPQYESTVDELREIAPGLWLPARITAKTDFHQTGEARTSAAIEGSQKVAWAWTETLALEHAVVKPGHPAGFFHDVKIPDGIPVYTIEQGRLVDGGFEDESPGPQAAEHLVSILEKIRANEQRYSDLEVVGEQDYRYLSSIDSENGMLPTKSWKKRVRSVTHGNKASFSEESSTESGDGKFVVSSATTDFDGSRLRTTQTQPDSSQTSDRVVPPSEGITAVPILRPHTLLFRGNRFDFPPSNQFSSLVGSSNLAQQVTWLGEEKRNGLRCDVLRRGIITRRPSQWITFSLIWLARDRNYLPIRLELHQPENNQKLPIGVMTAEDLREIEPGVWFPFAVKELWFQTRGQTPVAAGILVVERRTDFVVQKAVVHSPAAAKDAAQPAKAPDGAK